LNKIFLILKITFICFVSLFAISSCSTENKRQKETKHIVLKKDKILKQTPLKQLPKDTLVVKDVINYKNVRSFFLEYGKKNPETKLLLKTRLGNIHISLFKETPLHRASFIYLIKNGYYNNTCFHRIVEDFIIQGGWSEKSIVNTYRSQLNNYKLPSEFRKGIVHRRGSLSSARRWLNNPNKKSNPFEFFIIQTKIDCSHLNNEHTVFGQVTKGFNVIDKIIGVKLDGHSEWPQLDVDIQFEILE